MMRMIQVVSVAAVVFLAGTAGAQVAVKAKLLRTMGPAGDIADGVVVMTNGKIVAVGPAASTAIPEGYKVFEAAVASPGLIDAHSTVGLSGLYNTKHDSDQLERSGPVQPELRALDAYNPLDKLVEYVRSFGVTMIHTGHAPGELISGQTAIFKTVGATAEEALVRSPAAVAVTLTPFGQRSGREAPGTRAKQMAMLRAELIKAQEYRKKLDNVKDEDKKPGRDLRLEMLAGVLYDGVPLLITANRAQDISSVLRLAEEFKVKVWLDSAAEAYVIAAEIKKAGHAVILHPPMARAFGDLENANFESAALLKAAGIDVALQSGYEAYVPKTRVVLFEAAIAAANGLSSRDALATITINAAKVLGVAGRVGSLEAGKDGDVAMYDGDMFEYTTHCVGTIVDGKVVFEGKR